MIRINLLPGQQRPKKQVTAASSASLQTILLGIGTVAGLGILGGLYYVNDRNLKEAQTKLTSLRDDKDRLERIKAEIDDYQRQKSILDQRIAVIQDLQRNRVGGQELLDVVATTVSRVDSLWLTVLSRRGNQLNIEGTAASISAVANLVTQLKRAGYFDRVEIKEAKQDERNRAVQVFLFTITADFVLPGSKTAEGQPEGQKKG
jgi:Tfp pilus assembly protein PilN